MLSIRCMNKAVRRPFKAVPSRFIDGFIGAITFSEIAQLKINPHNAASKFFILTPSE